MADAVSDASLDAGYEPREVDVHDLALVDDLEAGHRHDEDR